MVESIRILCRLLTALHTRALCRETRSLVSLQRPVTNHPHRRSTGTHVQQMAIDWIMLGHQHFNDDLVSVYLARCSAPFEMVPHSVVSGCLVGMAAVDTGASDRSPDIWRRPIRRLRLVRSYLAQDHSLLWGSGSLPSLLAESSKNSFIQVSIFRIRQINQA